MANLFLKVATTTVDVRYFDVREKISEPFSIEVEAVSPDADLDFEKLIGQAAHFRLTGPTGTDRNWHGVCTRCEQTRVESTGLSHYRMSVAPRFWLLSQKQNYRLFQHRSALQIVEELLKEWGIEYRLATKEHYPALELRIQYGESDYDFLSRIMEEAGVSFYFDFDAKKGSVLVVADQLEQADPQSAPLPYIDQGDQAQSTATELGTIEFLSKVQLRRELRPGKVQLRDFDFRRPRYALAAAAALESGAEAELERYRYLPGSFVTEGHRDRDTPTADDRGVARADEDAGSHLATRMLQAETGRRRRVEFETSAFDLRPGRVFSMAGHARRELAPTSKLLVEQLHLEGGVADGESWRATGSSLFADSPFRPELKTNRPQIVGVQSAIVVGPERETVHTDEFGRVRVQFHWDREGQFDDGSSCWMRVSQAWAGPGYGLFNLPRVGHEVLVGFVAGDPDQPVVVGRVFNGAQQVPYPLPGSKMMSGWKTDSNSNIILFDDTPGDEMFYSQAERDRLGIVKQHEAYLTGGRRTTYIGTTNKTLVRTTNQDLALGHHKTLAGITNTHTGALSFKAQGGFNAELKGGLKVKAAVQPVLPFITALMDVNDAQAAIINKLPSTLAPDLKQLLPKKAGGPGPAQPKVQPPPPATKEETEKKLKHLLGSIGGALNQFDADEVEAMTRADDLNSAVDAMLGSLAKRNDSETTVAIASAQSLAQELKILSQQAEALDAPTPQAKNAPPQAKNAPQAQKQKQSGMFEKLLVAIAAMVIPETKIEISHQKIKLETQDASIELDKGDITLEAKGDITIKADGKISIEGASVALSPNPCN